MSNFNNLNSLTVKGPAEFLGEVKFADKVLESSIEDLNYSKGLTGNIQEQLNYLRDNKSEIGHDHKATEVSGLSAVATSGSYGDLIDRPKIPSIEGLATEAYVNSQIDKIEIPKYLSDFTDDVSHRLVTDIEKTNWNLAKVHADSAHAPVDAEKNQNAFSNIKVGNTTVAAETTTDTLTLEGSNVTITPDTTNDKITFTVADGNTSTKGIVKLTNSTSSTSTTTAATPSSVKAAYDLASQAKTIAEDKADSDHTHSLGSFGITATASELSYSKGLTENIQSQLNSKSTIGKKGTGENSEVFNDYENNVASGSYSHAEGHKTTAEGQYSHAEGYSLNVAREITTEVNPEELVNDWRGYNKEFTLALGDYSHAEGLNCLSIGTASHAEGERCLSQGEHSHAEGVVSYAIGRCSHAEGNCNWTYGDYSHVEGSNTYIPEEGEYAHAEGYLTNARNIGAHAEGFKTYADGKYSHAEGYGPTATGDYSHSGGIYSTASGYSSFAHGGNCYPTAMYSAAIGDYLHADNFASIALGKNNKSMNTGGENNTQVGDVLVIGNGTGTSDNTLSNCFRVTYTGATYGLTAFNSSGADYAEFVYPWYDDNIDNEDRIGYFVTFKDGKLHKATSKDIVIGVTSGNPSVVGNADEDYYWRYERDDFNRIVFEDVEEEVQKADEEGNPIFDENGKPVLEKTGNIIKNGRMKLSKDYDPTLQDSYIERKNRQEWDYVGMLGVIPVRDDGTCLSGQYCKCNDEGIATLATIEDVIANRFTYTVLERVSDNVIKVLMTIK